VKLPAGTPDLTSLDLFLTVAEYGSMGQAARVHGMTQPAVSMRMSQLERQMGLQLLERTPSGTRLTPLGSAVVDWARQVVDATVAMMAATSALRAGSESGLRVAASVTMADHLLPGWLVALHVTRPDIAISLEVHNSTEVIRLLAEGEADIGFVEGLLPAGVLQARKVATDRLAVVTGPDHPWARRRRPVTGKELVATPLILRETGSGTRQVLDESLAAWGSPSRPLLQLGSTTAILGAVRRGEGPGVISILAAADDLAAGRVVEIPTTGVNLSRELHAVWRRGRKLSPPAQRLLRVTQNPAATR
jgi:DNA-binding transcriptional LysR family regulator